MLSTIIYVAFIAFLASRNAAKAKFKGKSVGLFAFLTVILFILGQVTGALLVVFLFCRDMITFPTVNTPEAMAAFQEQLNQAFASNPFHSITVELFGIGGYLLVRYIIEQFPEKNNTTRLPLWPDNESAQ